MKKSQDWKTQTLIIGGLIGLISGVAASYIVIQNAERQKRQPKLTAGDSVKVGLSLLGVLRLISDIGTDNK